MMDRLIINNKSHIITSQHGLQPMADHALILYQCGARSVVGYWWWYLYYNIWPRTCKYFCRLVTLTRQVLEESEQKNGRKYEIQVKLISIIRPRTCYYFCRLVISI